MQILLSFTGFHDPFASSGIVGSEQEGPVLSLVRLRGFDQVYLFSTPNTLTNTDSTVAALRERHPKLTVKVCSFTYEDPTDYFAILRGLRSCFRAIAEAHPSAQYYIGTASGTPQMHACWLLLAASGEIPARLLQARNVKFVTKDAPVITEVDLSRPEFPRVRSNTMHDFESTDTDGRESASAVRELEIVGDHDLMQRAVQKAISFGPYEIPVLLTGESGTGKDKIAQLIHRLSGRTGQFVAVNCAGIPAQLAESMLFGHVKGAFTGATGHQTGKLELANGGTFFLDELGELSLDNQAKLLRVLNDKVVEPLGGKKGRKVDCRIIAATNVDLHAAMKEGKFREDLYYRIAAATIELPPLRIRRTDVPKLALHFVDLLNHKYRFKKPRSVAPEALTALIDHDWPGNVRELQNVVENAAILAANGRIEPNHFNLRRKSSDDALLALPDPHEGFRLEDLLSHVRAQLYSRALDLSQGNASGAARLLGVTPQAVLKFSKAIEK